MIYHHRITGFWGTSHGSQVYVSLLSSHSALALGWGTPCGFGAGPAKSLAWDQLETAQVQKMLHLVQHHYVNMDGSGDSGNCDLRGTITGKEKMVDLGGEKTGETWCINQENGKQTKIQQE